ncbi:uncharacterized protein BDZ99DRAFT_34628 [Mytilinidion resinicola]|uniref:Uncharacterized protein n=1 Tax=Mytilinidion resinicola TaxID=574789 RepID=A0A6A6YMA0_9PEZI|nr:uncharacterized protein BDZ99DRAFT_34628 [Mytilinidion resinicola]KAF2809703.1 hypothetical protein BDZ99DRAFT_34628 [Mytilinidion resinicola]
MSFTNEDAYKEYAALEERPTNVEPWTKNKDGEIEIAPGELFCRFNMAENDFDEVELCPRNTRYSHNGNLRAHVKIHKVKVARVRPGTLSMMELRQVNKFYKDLMARYNRPYNPEAEDAVEVPTTPVKGPPTPVPKTRRPRVPLIKTGKNKGRVNLTQARLLSGVVGRRCAACVKAKRTGKFSGCEEAVLC